MEQEVWKPVVSHPDLYEVSNLGRVRNPHTGLIKALQISKTGYWNVSLSRHGRTRAYVVHQLVAEAFHGPPPAGMECAHLNGVRTDARASNLAYCTRKENHAHKKLHGTQPMGSDHHNSVFTEDLVMRLRETITTSLEARYVAEAIGVSKYAVRAAVMGISWSHLPGAHRPVSASNCPNDNEKERARLLAEMFRDAA